MARYRTLRDCGFGSEGLFADHSRPLTLHGGSGTADQGLKQAIRAGINIVHINTELRLAWRHGLEQGLAAREDEVVPYKILPPAVAAVKEVVSSRLRLFTNPTA